MKVPDVVLLATDEPYGRIILGPINVEAIPANIGGLQLWLEDSSILGDGTVTGWQDLSGYSRDGVVTGTNITRTVADPIFGSHDSVASVGNGTIATPAFPLACPYTIAIVATGTTSYFWTRADPFDYLFGSVGATYRCVRGGITAVELAANWGLSAVARTIILSTDGTAAGTAIHINGVAQTLTIDQGDAGTAPSLAPFAIFGNPGATFGSAFSIAAATVYNKALTDADRQLLEAYYRTRYRHY